MQAMDQRTMLIVGQVFIVILAVILALAPNLYKFAILLYFVGIIAISMYKARSTGSSGVSREEVEKARTLFREEKAMELAAEDEEYLREVSKQVRAMFIPLLLFPVYIVIFQAVPALEPRVAEALQGLGIADARVARLLLWLAAFEGMFALNQVVRKLTGGASKPAPMVPPAYRVTEKGIVIKGGLGRVIPFPLPSGAEVRLDEKRNYVEIEMGKGVRMRFYTRKARRLYELLLRHGVKERGRGGTQENGRG